MPKLVARLAVSIAAAVVITTGLEAMRLRHHRVVAAPLAEEAPLSPVAPIPRLDFGRAVAAEPVAAPARARHDAFGMARIYGRVVDRSGNLDELQVNIEDDKRSYTPKLGDQGTFEINLPVGTYSIVASSGDDIAVAEVADLLADESREVVLVLTPGASIAGRVEGCDGRCRGVTVRVDVPATGQRVSNSESDAKGEFAVDGLVPGRAYDVVFEAAGKRRLVMHAVKAPRQDLVATLEPTPTLVGGFGLEPGQDCPMEAVTLESPGENDTRDTSSFDHDCRFRFTDLPGGESVRLSADGEGWHFELEVALPAHGDPPFVCLHPTCREPQPQPKAELTITTQGRAEVMGHVRFRYAGKAESIFRHCGRTAGECALDDLRPGQGVHVVVHTRGCEDYEVTLDLHAGANHLAFPCEVVRAMQGVFRGATSESALAGARIRCSHDYPALPVSGRFFSLQCPARLPAIEYQLVENGPWQSATILLDEGNPTGFVEITAG
jgi:hypothetical protein